jgi:hypothetical protein
MKCQENIYFVIMSVSGVTEKHYEQFKSGVSDFRRDLKQEPFQNEVEILRAGR